MKISKILFITFIIFIILISFSVSSFAVIDLEIETYEGYKYNSIPDIPQKVLENYQYYCIVPLYNYNGKTSSNNMVVLLYSNNPIYIENFTKDSDRYVVKSKDICDLGYYYCLDSTSPNTWMTYTLGLWRNNLENAHFYMGDARFENPIFYYSNCDIYYEGTTDIFFQKTPLMEKYQIPQVMEVTQLTEVIAGIMKMIIPVGLILLSTVLVVFLIKSVISRVA